MKFFVDNKALLKNKIMSGVSFYNFFLCGNSSYFNLFIDFNGLNFNNKVLFLNLLGQFNLKNFFYKPLTFKNRLGAAFALGLNFLDFINAEKCFLEESSLFSNGVVGAWKFNGVYNDNLIFNNALNFKNLFSGGFGLVNLFALLFYNIKNRAKFNSSLYSLFLNIFFCPIYFLIYTLK